MWEDVTVVPDSTSLLRMFFLFCLLAPVRCCCCPVVAVPFCCPAVAVGVAVPLLPFRCCCPTVAVIVVAVSSLPRSSPLFLAMLFNPLSPSPVGDPSVVVVAVSPPAPITVVVSLLLAVH